MTRRPPTAPAQQPPPRVGLVLGAGGTLGVAWMAGALVALQERLARSLGDLDLIVGTSAGSILAAALRCGVSAAEIAAHQGGAAMVALPTLRELDRDAGPLPPLPRMRLGSPRLLASTARAPHRVHPWVAASALLLQGRARHRSLTALVDALLLQEQGESEPAGVAWPRRGETWIMAVDYETGRRTAFGRDGAPAASLPDAVVASCSIPGWYEPKNIDGRPYVDGGVRSSTSLDLLAKVPLDHVYVLAPMASYTMDNPLNPYARLERMVRRVLTAALTREARKVRASGARVTVLTPGPEDLAAIGVNLMDPARRQRVLETSLRTAPATLAAATARHRAA
ncbi:MAG TPA: patatin-like phospholipase family protein [Pilimelia sp.]|nr:patatin-like phospholipase family protein [Pilimelia sp.]